MSKILVELQVNGESHELAIEPHRTLLEVLRENLGLTGAKEACDLGECGVCMVLMGGKPVLSCLVLAADAQGQEIVTIEGLAQGGKPHPLQQAFVEHGAIQCGYCTPGMIMTAKGFLNSHPAPTEEDVRKAIGNNICRCTGYKKIVEAIMDVASQNAVQSGEELAKV
ncbi:MAG: (2Fe-2S)-binding protein [Clostridia bacterium]|nr:MAG: (2Fe-2S)-binding protein [Clostridia bacterium]